MECKLCGAPCIDSFYYVMHMYNVHRKEFGWRRSELCPFCGSRMYFRDEMLYRGRVGYESLSTKYISPHLRQCTAYLKHRLAGVGDFL